MKRTTGGMIAVVMLLGTTAQAADWRAPLYDPMDGPDFARKGGLYYKQNYEQSAGHHTFTRDGTLRLSVNSLCPPEDAGCSERAEVWERPALRVPYFEGIWYGFSVRFGDPIPQDDHRYLIAQWKREIGPAAKGDYSPFLAFRLNRGQLFATVETRNRPVQPKVNGRCPTGTTPVWVRAEDAQMRVLVSTDAGWSNADGPEFSACTADVQVKYDAPFPSPSTTDWTRFAVYTRPGPAGDGMIRIFANDRPIVTITGRIGHADAGLGPNQYFKFGPYRDGAPDRWTLYYDDFRRSPDCADVLPATACAERP